MCCSLDKLPASPNYLSSGPWDVSTSNSALPKSSGGDDGSRSVRTKSGDGSGAVLSRHLGLLTLRLAHQAPSVTDVFDAETKHLHCLFRGFVSLYREPNSEKQLFDDSCTEALRQEKRLRWFLLKQATFTVA